MDLDVYLWGQNSEWDEKLGLFVHASDELAFSLLLRLNQRGPVRGFFEDFKNIFDGTLMWKYDPFGVVRPERLLVDPDRYEMFFSPDHYGTIYKLGGPAYLDI